MWKSAPSGGTACTRPGTSRVALTGTPQQDARPRQPVAARRTLAWRTERARGPDPWLCSRRSRRAPFSSRLGPSPRGRVGEAEATGVCTGSSARRGCPWLNCPDRESGPFPVTGHRPVRHFCRTLVKHDFGGDERSALAGSPSLWRGQGPTRKETRGPFAVQPTAIFDVQRLVDGSMTDAHGEIQFGKSKGSRRAICCGLQALAQRRRCRRPCRRPLNGTTGPGIRSPLAMTT